MSPESGPRLSGRLTDGAVLFDQQTGSRDGEVGEPGEPRGLEPRAQGARWFRAKRARRSD